MVLTSIVIQGFKSFADKTVLKFGRGITAVVGPNGSGKSNISDAVRWVLGEQSTKNLRGQSMEDVIFGGTNLRRPHGYCEVTLNIDNSDRSLNFDNDSVSVTRRFYRSHESEYIINGVSVRLKDINELFMDTGLGRDGYSMIGQGKIDSIISSKSQERRDIFEEASGISKYRYRKTEAERKLSLAEDNLLRLKDILDELESRVGPLKEQSEKAEKFLELSDEKKKYEIGIWIHMLENSKDAIRNHQNKIDLAQLNYDEINGKLEAFDRQNEENSRRFAELNAEIENEYEEIARKNEELTRADGEVSVIENELLHKNESLEHLEEEISELKKSDEEARIDIAEKLKQADEKKAEAESLNAELLKLESEISVLLSDSENISREIEELVKQSNVLAVKTADIRVTMLTADSSVKEIKERKDNLNSVIEAKNNELKALQENLAESDSALSEINDSIVSCQNALNGYELKLKTKVDKAQKLKEDCESLRLDIESKKRRIQILKDLENSMEGFSNSVKTVMAESKKGLLKGVNGTVSSIIGVDKKYAVAIETALGATIQHIVVDTEADAKRAIEHLKSTGSGRATFLPVSSVKSREFKETGFENMYGYIGLAPDLITSDAKYSEIIKYLLGNTVVCEDLDSAAAISKKFSYRFKTVSLDGQVVNAGGSFTGGSLIKNSGILSRAGDIERYTADVEKLNTKLLETEKNYESAKSELAIVEADIADAKAVLLTSNEDKIRFTSEILHIKENIDTIKKDIASLEAEKTDGDAKIKEFELVSVAAAKELTDIEVLKSKVQTQIDEKSGGRDDLAAKREEFSSKITAVKLDIASVLKDADVLLGFAKSLEETINDRENRAKMLDSQVELVTLSIADLKEKIASSGLDKEKKNSEILLHRKKIEELSAQREETEKNGVILRNSEKERMAEREKIGGELARLSERKEVMLAEYDNIIKQLYDEYQLTRAEAEKIAIVIDNFAEAKRKLAEIKSGIRSLGNVNVAAIEEYKEVYERYQFLNEQLNDVEKSRAELHRLINQLTVQMKELFTDGLAKINENFSKTFKELFGGGTAGISLSDPENVLESGIDINVNLPGKTVPSLDGLSGGEKALIALAIYFAIMRVNAPPFCFLDEVDTALDDINVERFAEYMRRPDFSTQFICVTHRRGTMEAADMLYGVTMQEKGVTKLLELNVAELEKKLELEVNV